MVWIYLFQSLLDQSKVFSINRKSHREFLKKPLAFHVFYHFQTFQKLFSLSSINLRFKARFLSFSLKFIQGFLTSKANKTFITFLFHLFSCVMHIGKISNLRKIGIFVDLSLFFGNWSMGFCCGMIYNCSMWINLINFLICEKLEFLELETTRFGDFVQLSLIW